MSGPSDKGYKVWRDSSTKITRKFGRQVPCPETEKTSNSNRTMGQAQWCMVTNCTNFFDKAPVFPILQIALLHCKDQISTTNFEVGTGLEIAVFRGSEFQAMHSIQYL
ncbi:unnamed protein product [Calypogeia fissa]